jgi:FKBP-type peptidyl-prolyl cis-trans isomerase FklB
MEMIARANSMKGEAYRKQNGQNPDVKTLENGLQYKVLKNGDLSGAMPSINSTVSVYYEGKLVDGKVFDGNVGSGNPISFPLNGVIKGWTEILQKMHKGDVWEVTIPAELAYGQNGAGGSIGPNETLIFMIELVDFK